MAKVNLTAQRVRELFDYDKETGLLTRRIRCGTKQAGCSVGCINMDGHLKTKVDGRMFVVHRLIWLHVTGAFPVAQIDHIDGDKINNRWVNLRDVSPAENSQNRWKAANVPNRSSRFLGVSQDRGKPSWRAKIQIGAMKINLGSFATEEQAHAAYIDAKRKYHPTAFIAAGEG